jgi:hypothetical protein
MSQPDSPASTQRGVKPSSDGIAVHKNRAKASGIRGTVVGDIPHPARGAPRARPGHVIVPKKPEKSPAEKAMARYALLNPTGWRSTWKPGNITWEEIQVDNSAWITLPEAEERLSISRALEEEKLLLHRAEARLGKGASSLGELSPEEIRILRMTQKEHNSFRGSNPPQKE